MLAACGGGDGAGLPPTPQEVDVAIAGKVAVKVRAAADQVAVLEERVVALSTDGPQRRVALLPHDGANAQAYEPPPGWALVDMAIHPSGDVSLVLTTARAVRLVRLDRHAVILSDQPVVDAQSPSDPYFAFSSAPKDDEALQPVLTHDAA